MNSNIKKISILPSFIMLFIVYSLHYLALLRDEKRFIQYNMRFNSYYDWSSVSILLDQIGFILLLFTIWFSDYLSLFTSNVVTNLVYIILIIYSIVITKQIIFVNDKIHGYPV